MSSKKIKRLYDRYLKAKITRSLETYKSYKNLFGKIKRSKKLYYQNKLQKFEHDCETTWRVMCCEKLWIALETFIYRNIMQCRC